MSIVQNVTICDIIANFISSRFVGSYVELMDSVYIPFTILIWVCVKERVIEGTGQS